ncbi:hypothetical protein [Inediibacterium massiliense]|uniref:hypothetical protein n=1 Tax=Inediibacterium massiliense TaxID=1658111 RepID=UPI0018FE9DDC|nr:hypothetical protein [Inediibacterium massiliense]
MKKNNDPKKSIPHFKWGGNTPEWECEAENLADYIDHQDEEPKEEKEKKIAYGTQKQYW